MTAPYSPEVRKRLDASIQRALESCVGVAESAKSFGSTWPLEMYEDNAAVGVTLADLRSALAHIETLEGALKAVGWTVGKDGKDYPARGVGPLIARRALNGASHDQG